MDNTAKAKNENQSVAIVKPDQFAIMQLQDMGNIAAALKTNTQGAGIGKANLNKITVPPGGKTSWSINDPLTGNETQTENLICIPIHWTTARARWGSEFTGQTNQPLCFSKDGQRGCGDPGGYCPHCEFAQWHNKIKPECRQSRDVFIMFQNSKLPAVLSVPPTSIKVFEDFMLNLGVQGIFYFHSIIDFQLREEKLKDRNISFSKVHPVFMQRLDPEQAEIVMQYRESFKKAMSAAPAEQTAAVVDPFDEVPLPDDTDVPI